MGSDGSPSGPRPRSEPVCASCGRPVGTAIRRRKLRGVYVPVWGPGPCHNPRCDACVDAREAADAETGPDSLRPIELPQGPGPIAVDTAAVQARAQLADRVRVFVAEAQQLGLSADEVRSLVDTALRA